MNPQTNYHCPDCCEELFIANGKGNDLICECHGCNKKFRVSQDGEFVNGAWRDTSTIKEIEL